MRTRTRRGSTLLLPLVLVLALAGCGGGDEAAGTQARPDPPLLAAPVAERLAARSDAVSDGLAAGDVCGAAHEADALHGEALAAVEAGEVPPALRDELLATARALVDAVNCPPPPPEEVADEGDDDEGDEGDDDGDDDEPGEGKKKGKKKGKKQ
jgi:hypothetical protein